MTKIFKSNRMRGFASFVIVLALALGMVAVFAGNSMKISAASGYAIEITGTSVSGFDLSIEGNASAHPYVGIESQQHVTVSDWGDGSIGTLADTNLVFGDNGGSDKFFDGTWSSEHTYANPGEYTITAKVCHQINRDFDCTGAEGSDMSTDTVIVVIEVPTENTLPLCTDGIDNDGDDLVDLADPDCAEFIPTLTVTKVVDGGAMLATDFDLFVDGNPVTTGVEATYSAGAHVVSETTVANYAGVISGDCALDGSITLSAGAMASCTITNTFFSDPPVPECSDGLDNDQDEYTDFGGQNPDPECSSAEDDSEEPVNIFGCMDPVANNYNENATNSDNSCTYNQCIDGVDNDDDGLIDFAGGDPGCTDPQDNDEIDPVVDACPNEQTDPGVQTSGPCNSDDVCPNDPGIQTSTEECSPQQCEDETWNEMYFSDTGTMVGEGNAVELTSIHSAWTAVIAGAEWIWSTDPVVTVPDPTTETEVFTETFTVVGTPTGGSLMIATDNTYTVTINGNPLCADASVTNFTSETQDTCAIDADDLITGENTLEITVTNEAHGDRPESNPAGLMYKLSIDGNECVPPPPPPPPQCSDDVDNADSEDELVDENDPGCHTDGDSGNSESYDPNDNDESNTVEEVSLCEDNSANNFGQPLPCTFNESSGGGGGSSSGSRRNSNSGGQVLGAATDICNIVKTHMRRGYVTIPDEVQTLQNFLNAYMSSGLIVDSKFGPKTEAAVKAFQLRQRANVMNPWGLTAPTGIFYLTSLAEAKRVMCPLDYGNLPIHRRDELIPWSKNPTQVPPKAN